MFRPEIKVLDCTIRDGGLMNDSYFTLETVQNVYRALCEAGVDIVELGYRNSRKMFSPTKFGPWRFCDEELLKQVVGDHKCEDTKIAVMQDAHKALPEDLLPKEQSVVDIVRVATYVKDVDKAIHLANNAAALGYESAINIMSVSHVLERDLDEALQQIEEETQVYSVCIVDSYGSLYCEGVEYLINKFRKFLKTKELAIHCHNNQQLAYANTIEAIIHNVNYLDGTLYGLGRAAGNCPLELLIGFLKNPKYNVRPLLDVIGKEIIPLTKQMTWGYTIPYMITGMLNRHPEAGLEMMRLPPTDPDAHDYATFFDRQTRLAD
ncbi:MAG: aldolase catalytic domain-containing protein [Proteobacteria bacterium]|jgi:4-hydroxy 2-oxovalerate aldolase|nr:aldolase catalytic domain-containing protein [Pseudomonadota bacterium]NLN62434.1 nucleoid-structuring protein H-NS [Myxococcales bacterium]